MSNNPVCQFFYFYGKHFIIEGGRTFFGNGKIGPDDNPIDEIDCGKPDDFEVADQLKDCVPFSDHVSTEGLEGIKTILGDSENGINGVKAVESLKTLNRWEAFEPLNPNNEDSQQCVKIIFYAAIELLNDIRPVLLEAIEGGFLE